MLPIKSFSSEEVAVGGGGEARTFINGAPVVVYVCEIANSLRL